MLRELPVRISPLYLKTLYQGRDNCTLTLLFICCRRKLYAFPFTLTIHTKHGRLFSWANLLKQLFSVARKARQPLCSCHSLLLCSSVSLHQRGLCFCHLKRHHFQHIARRCSLQAFPDLAPCFPHLPLLLAPSELASGLSALLLICGLDQWRQVREEIGQPSHKLKPDDAPSLLCDLYRTILSALLVLAFAIATGARGPCSLGRCWLWIHLHLLLELGAVTGTMNCSSGRELLIHFRHPDLLDQVFASSSQYIYVHVTHSGKIQTAQKGGHRDG